MPQPIRILHVVTWMSAGGLETFIMNLYRHIDRDLVQFDFLVMREQRAFYDDEIEQLGGIIYRVPPIGVRSLQSNWRALKTFFQEHPYRIVHSHIDTLSTLPLRAAKSAGVPVRIAHSHNTNMDIDGKMPFRLTSRILLPSQATGFMACSIEAGQWLFGEKRSARGQVRVIPNGVDTERFRFSPNRRREMRNALGIPAEVPVMLHVGRFSPQKNHSFLLEIFSELMHINPQAHLILVGAGTGLASAEHRVNAYGLGSNVHFMGVRSNVQDFLSASDIFVLPSLYEGLPVTLIEAQSSGIVCFASAGRVPSEANVSSSVHFIGLKRGAEYWAERIAQVRLPSNSERLRGAQLVADAGYDIQGVAQQMQDFYLNKHYLYGAER